MAPVPSIDPGIDLYSTLQQYHKRPWLRFAGLAQTPTPTFPVIKESTILFLTHRSIDPVLSAPVLAASFATFPTVLAEKKAMASFQHSLHPFS
jgi:hypothetical protein